MTDELPIELECFLLRWGFFEREHAPGYKSHAPFSRPKIKKKLNSLPDRDPNAWMPTKDNQEPPF